MAAGDSLADRVLAGDIRAASRLMRSIEDGDPSATRALQALFPNTGRAWVVGITGSPGSGKSTLTDKLIAHYRAAGKRVGVIAVDPSSPFTGGAILGDRIRMQEHATDPGVFIRSLATRGHLGGMALAAPEAVRILDAAGSDVIVVETVGVGQAEVDVAASTDTTLVVVAPGWGDAVQVAKAGILEVADVFVVNKADKEGAQEAARDLRQMLKMGQMSEWTPPVVLTSSLSGDGMDELWEAVETHRKHQESTGDLQRLRKERLLAEVETMEARELREGLRSRLSRDSELAQGLAERRVDPYR